MSISRSIITSAPIPSLVFFGTQSAGRSAFYRWPQGAKSTTGGIDSLVLSAEQRLSTLDKNGVTGMPRSSLSKSSAMFFEYGSYDDHQRGERIC